MSVNRPQRFQTLETGSLTRADVCAYQYFHRMLDLAHGFAGSQINRTHKSSSKQETLSIRGINRNQALAGLSSPPFLFFLLTGKRRVPLPNDRVGIPPLSHPSFVIKNAPRKKDGGHPVLY